MRYSILLFAVGLCACSTGKIAQLEKENADLRGKLDAVSRNATLDLQEKCATQARIEFDSEGWDKPTLQRAATSATFVNHYNTKVNKCFIQVDSTDDKTAPGETFLGTSISDAFEGKNYAQYDWKVDKTKKYWEVPPFYCKVTPLSGEPITCHSDGEFKQLIKQFMEQ